MRPRAPDLRLSVIAALAWVAGIGAVMVPEHAGGVALASGLAVLLGIAVGITRGSSSLHLVAVGFAIACAIAVQVAADYPERVAALEVSYVMDAEATITSKVEPATGGWRFDAELSIADVRVPATVYVPGDVDPRLDLGATVSLTGRVSEPYAGQRAAVRVIAEDPDLSAPPPPVLLFTSDLRRAFTAEAAAFPGYGAQLIPGLAVGDTTLVSEELDAQMTQSSLSHLTAVSGANCAIVTGGAFWLAAVVGLRRGARVAAALIVLSGFILLVTPEPSVVRAGAMAAGAMLALMLGRARSGIAIISLAVAVLLLLDPWLATSIGFALSVAATAALLTLAGPIAGRLDRVMPRMLALAVAVPLAAQLVCAPIIILIDPHVSVVGTLANLVAGPAAPLATITGLLACLLGFIPGVGFALCALTWVPASWIAGVAEFSAGVPAGRFAWLDGVGGAALLAAVTASALLLALTRSQRLRLLSGALVACAVVAMVGSVVVRTVIAPMSVPTGWSIAACDVGQGDAMVVRAGENVAVIDTGPEPDKLSECLQLLQVSHVSLLVITHFDLDHVGGSEALIGRVDRVIHGPAPDPLAEHRLSLLEQSGAELMPASTGMTGALGTAQWQILWPRNEALAGNDASVVWEISGGDLPRSIFLGDLSAAAQQALMATGDVRGPYDLVKVAHHGSADQEPRLYDEIAASIALIGVGENDYGHPRQETLNLLTGDGSLVLRTDQWGTVTVIRGADGWGVWHSRRVE